MKKLLSALLIVSLAVLAVVAWNLRLGNQGRVPSSSAPSSTLPNEFMPIESLYLAGDLSQAVYLSAKAPDDWQLQLLAADCYRQLGLTVRMEQQLTKLNQFLSTAKGFPSPSSAEVESQVALVKAMHKIQYGQLDLAPSAMVKLLITGGARSVDAYSVVVQGAMARDDFDAAAQLLDQWEEHDRSAGILAASAQRAFLRAIYLNLKGDRSGAEGKLIELIDANPRHELAWLSLADIYSRPPNIRLSHSEILLNEFVKRFPFSSEGPRRLGQVQRRLGVAQPDVRTIATASAGERDTSPASSDSALQLEQAKIHFDAGDYAMAAKLLTQIGLATPVQAQQLTDLAFHRTLDGQSDMSHELQGRVSWSATALALAGDVATAEQIFDTATDRSARLRRLQDLSARQSVTSMLQPASQPKGIASDESLEQVRSLTTSWSARPAPSIDFPNHNLGMALYQQHCAVCHGIAGDGRSRWAVQTARSPRNFRDEPIRFVSATNALALDEDLKQTIRHGQSGGAMPAFPKLSDAEVQSIVLLLREFRLLGLKETYEREVAAGSAIDAWEPWMMARTEPSQPLPIPELPSSPESIQRGGQLFQTVGCVNCHAQRDSLPMNALFDSLGRPTPAPNLATDRLRGGDKPADLYKRIKLGLPGTPHPALVDVSESDVVALVGYLITISQN
ncbi:MAG: c-type cytochrome [Pirellulaceae bacterium]|nr:c-type cytochrome [Pirellulaceae bacterium]